MIVSAVTYVPAVLDLLKLLCQRRQAATGSNFIFAALFTIIIVKTWQLNPQLDLNIVRLWAYKTMQLLEMEATYVN